ESLPELRVLRGDAERAAAGGAVRALAGGDADSALVVGDAGDLLVAVERHQRRVAERYGGCAQGQGLGYVAAVADAARDDEVDLVGQPHVLERAARLGDRGHQR